MVPAPIPLGDRAHPNSIKESPVMTKFISLLLALAMGLVASASWPALAQESDHPYDQVARFIREIDGRKLSRAEKDAAIRNIINIAQGNNKIDKAARNSKAGHGPNQENRPGTTGSKTNDRLRKCFQDCLESGLPGDVCYGQCTK